MKSGQNAVIYVSKDRKEYRDYPEMIATDDTRCLSSKQPRSTLYPGAFVYQRTVHFWVLGHTIIIETGLIWREEENALWK